MDGTCCQHATRSTVFVIQEEYSSSDLDKITAFVSDISSSLNENNLNDATKLGLVSYSSDNGVTEHVVLTQD
jgi:hypothetical protein